MAPRWHDRSTQGGPSMSVRLDTSVAVVSKQSLRLLDATMREYPSRRRKTATAAKHSSHLFINFSRYLQNRRAKTPYSTSTLEAEYFEC